MRKLIGVAALMALLVVGFVDSSLALTFTCETVILDREADPLLAVFGKRFESARIDLQGDVVFIAHPKQGPRRLYLYPAVGAASVIASAGDSAPVEARSSAFERRRSTMPGTSGSSVTSPVARASTCATVAGAS